MYIYMVGGFNLSEKIWKSIGMITFPIYGKIENVPNHQQDINWDKIALSHFQRLGVNTHS